MELGALELQIFVSLIVILGTAFVALVCDYLKGSNESLREHNIELRVRREEQEKARPIEAVEWLQHLLGATRANPVRFGSSRTPRVVPGRTRSSAAAQPAAPAAASAAVATKSPTTAAPVETRPLEVVPAKPVVMPAVARSAEPVAAPEKKEVPAAVTLEPAAVGETANLTRSLSARMRRSGADRPTTSLLDTLPVPAWVKREQEEIAAARVQASTESSVESLPAGVQPEPKRESETALVLPTIAEVSDAQPVLAPEPPPSMDSITEVPVTEIVEMAAEVSVEPVLAAPIVAEAVAVESIAEASPLEPVSAGFIDEPAVAGLELLPVAEFEAVAEAQVEVSSHIEVSGEPLVAEVPVEAMPELVSAESLPEVAAEVVLEPVAEEQVPQEDSIPSFTLVREEVPEVSFADESEPMLSLVAPESESVRSDVFWSYKGLMDREPQNAETIRPETADASSEGYDIKPVSIELERTLTPVAEVPKREELTRENFILYRGLEPIRPVEQLPQFAAVENRTEPAAPGAAPVFGLQEALASPAVPEVDLPAGYQDRAVLQQLMTATGVLTGVVVAVGINDYAHQVDKIGVSAMQDLMRSVEQMIAGLLRPGLDFGCRSSEDEFILVFNKEQGGEAQRRLSTISERLWNFQLRSLTSFSVFFSWGAVEVQGETLADAAASASERMYQTKRNRKTVPMDQRRKKAVNL